MPLLQLVAIAARRQLTGVWLGLASMLVGQMNPPTAGTLKVVPEGQMAEGRHELIVDYWRVLGAAPGGDNAFMNKLNEVNQCASSGKENDAPLWPAPGSPGTL